MANEAYNLSARGVEIVISFVGKSSVTSPLKLLDLAGDQDPITIDDHSIGEPSFDLNGNFFRTRKLAPVQCHIAVVPGSQAEIDLNSLYLSDIDMEGDGIYIDQLSVVYPSHICNFYNGYFTGASMGYMATSRGAIKTKNYSFSFKTCDKNSSNAMYRLSG